MSCILNGIIPLGLVLLACGAQSLFVILPNITHFEKLLNTYQQDESHLRARRAIPRSDKEEILMLHNKLRGQVYPPASNMEYMVRAATPTQDRRPKVPSVLSPVTECMAGLRSPGNKQQVPILCS